MSFQTIRTVCYVAIVGSLVGCQSSGVILRKTGDGIRIEIDGQEFATHHKGCGEFTKPYLFPVIGVAGKLMTRGYPMRDALPDEEQDHPHHTGIWFAHGDVSGVDLWHGPRHENGGRIVVDEIVEMRSGSVGVLRTKNHYENGTGSTICTETRTMRFFGGEHGRFIDFDIRIHADRGPIVMGDTKEGIMAIRLPATLRLKGRVARGAAVTSAGIRGPKGWGTRGTWADYHGYVDGVDVGVAIFDHPANPVHPTRWLMRDYGLFGANPFGLHHFERKRRGAGKIEIPAGSELRFRYRFFFHRGGPVAAGVAAQYARFVEPEREG
jgi:Family of unknown function (DUF6807)